MKLPTLPPANDSRCTTERSATERKSLHRVERRSVNRFLECSVLLRVYTMLVAALYCYTSFNYPETIMYQVAHVDEFATFAMATLGALSVVGMVDMLINDVMPDKYIFLDALKTRHLVLMGIPICFAIQTFKCVTAGFSYAIIPFYLIYIVLVPLSAFVDVQKRHLKDLYQ
jgi:hypothetical protein